jgi:hypothetical protein
MTNSFLNEMYDDTNDGSDDLNDGLDDCDDCDGDDEWIDDVSPRRGDDPQGSYSPYRSPYYGSGYGPYYPRQSEPSITEGLLKALLASHAREIALYKQINKGLRSADKTKKLK